MMLLQNILETLRLWKGARETIKHKTVTAVQAKPVLDQLNNDLVWNQSALLGDLGRFKA